MPVVCFESFGFCLPFLSSFFAFFAAFAVFRPTLFFVVIGSENLIKILSYIPAGWAGQQQRIDEIKAKIKEAQARQNQAMMDDDDDAEEAAEVEMKALMKELEELTGGSIPKKKLEDAKSKDAQINKVLSEEW